MPAVAPTSELLFGCRLLRQVLGRGQENVFVSPASIGLALGMAAAGARGKTRAAIETALGLESAVAATEGKRLVARLAKLPPGVTVELANSLWARSGLPVSQEYAEEMRGNYRAEVRELDFSAGDATTVVNRFVARATHGEIGHVVDAIAADSLLLLVNATYFHGLWEDQFDRKKTVDKEFTTGSGGIRVVRLMHKTTDFAYMDDTDLQAVLVPYQQAGFNLLVVLPRGHLPSAAFGDFVKPTTMARILAALHKREGSLGLPKVRLNYGIDLEPELTELGMGPAFAPDADFSGVFGRRIPAYLSRVRHQTQLDIDEDGTTAAGSTVMDLSLGVPEEVPDPPPPFEMIVDRPFLIALIEWHTDLLLFLGVIGDPKPPSDS